MVRVIFALTEKQEYNLFKISEDKVMVQWYDNDSGNPFFTRDCIKNVLRYIESGEMIILKGDVSKW